MKELLKDKLYFDDPVLDYAEITANSLKGKEHILLFGAGITGTKVKRYLDSYCILVEYFIDNNPAKQGKQIDKIRILSEKEAFEKCPDATIVISCDAFMEITTQLVEDGFDEENIVYFEPDWLNSPKGQGDYIRKHLDDFQKVYDWLEDKKSRDVLQALLNYKITHKLKYLEGKADKLPYFDEELVHFNRDCVFFDCGAFIGDTLRDFIDYTKGNYGEVVCFEPNPENVHELEKYVSQESIKHVRIIEKGLSDKRQTLCFSGSSEGGRISNEGSSIECDSIDHLCFQDYKRVDMIKMDIEGSEYYALQGARKIIQRDKPILAICVYHKEDDYFKLTSLIKEINQGYKLYFRQYELSGEETVCIAINEE